MDFVLIISMLAFVVVCKAKLLDKAFVICEVTRQKTNIDNKTDRKSNQAPRPTVTPNEEKTDIYHYNTDLEHIVNLQIRLELYAFYNYLSMSRFFKKYDEDREGFAKYFRSAASEELEHAESFMKYQQMRGGDLQLYNLLPPVTVEDGWRNGRDVLVTAFTLEKNVTDEIFCLHESAVKKKDTDLVNFLEEKIIPEQYESMKKIKTLIQTLERACPHSSGTKWTTCDTYPLYELQFDSMLLKETK